MIYRIHKKSDRELYITTNKDSTYNKHSLIIPKDKLQNFILDYSASDSNMAVSYLDYDKDVKIIKSYYDSALENKMISYDEYYLNKEEFIDEDVCIRIIDLIDQIRINNSCNVLFNAYLNNNLDTINLDRIDISENEFSDYIYDNSKKLASALQNYKFNDIMLELYESGFIVSCFGLCSSIPVYLFVDKDLSVNMMLAASLSTIAFHFLKNDRRYKLIYENLIKMISNKNDNKSMIRKKSNLN